MVSIAFCPAKESLRLPLGESKEQIAHFKSNDFSRLRVLLDIFELLQRLKCLNGSQGRGCDAAWEMAGWADFADGRTGGTEEAVGLRGKWTLHLRARKS